MSEKGQGGTPRVFGLCVMFYFFVYWVYDNSLYYTYYCKARHISFKKIQELRFRFSNARSPCHASDTWASVTANSGGACACKPHRIPLWWHLRCGQCDPAWPASPPHPPLTSPCSVLWAPRRGRRTHGQGMQGGSRRLGREGIPLTWNFLFRMHVASFLLWFTFSLNLLAS